MSIFTVIAILVTISAIFSYINTRFVKLPETIGVMIIAIVASVLILIFGKTFPEVKAVLVDLASSIDFSKALLDIMLGFLLFAAALHFDINKLKKQKGPVLILSTVGVVLSTTIFGSLLYGVCSLFNIDMPLLYCFLFGALISPTDPVAVAAIFKKSKIPPRLETIISGESLFNDGIGLVLFVTLLEITTSDEKKLSLGTTAALFAQEVFGGMILGTVLGFFVYRLMKKLSQFQTIVLLSLALVMTISVVGTMLHVSVPLAVVCAGLLVGSKSFSHDQSGKMDEYLEIFWKLIDDLLNIVLFVMIGLQMVILPFLANHWLLGLVCIFLLLISRWLSIVLPVVLLKRSLNVSYETSFILTWAGLRGGISVALALSLPESDYRELILACSFFIVIFSIIVQGLTLNKVVDKLVD